MNPIKNREKTTEIFFENLNVPSFYIATTGILALYSSGKTTGLVLDAGESVTHTMPVFDGHKIQNSVKR